MTDTTIRKCLYLDARPERVWAFLTDPEKLATWFHKPPATLSEPGPYEMCGVESGNRLIWGQVQVARPFDYLEYSFSIAAMQGATSVVKWWLEPVPGGTRLRLEHSGLPAGEAAFGLTLAMDEGWDAHLGQLRVNLPEIAQPAAAAARCS